MTESPTPATPSAPQRGWFWTQLVIGWTPVWVLYVWMIISMHGGPAQSAAFAATRAIGAAALLGLFVLRATARFPWPRRMHAGFILGHVVGAITYALAWVLLAGAARVSAAAGGSLSGSVISPPGWGAFLFMGIWLYVAVAGVSYASLASERAARAEATAAQSQLAALRSQLDPHFLFNALHTVVQLIPIEPALAAEAAERLAALLRTVIEEERDRVPLRDERVFVERYLALEQLRFGDRLVTAFDIAPGLDDALVPPFALQTLVENAVRHGAAPREEPTTITVRAATRGAELALSVHDSGAGADPTAVTAGGTGLRRLRERLDALYGPRARLTAGSVPAAGFTATITLPLHRETD